MKNKSLESKYKNNSKTLLECRELNPGRQSDSLECYHYTTPDYIISQKIFNKYLK